MEKPYKFDEDGGSMKYQHSVTSPVDDSKDVDFRGFECNICLDIVQDPVITLCGHLYCWPCIYTWINSSGHQEPKCPVCKARVMEKNLIPVYSGDQGPNSCSSKVSKLGLVVPQRPQAQVFRPTSTTSSATYSRIGNRRFNVTRPGTRMVDPSSASRRFDMTRPGAGMLGERVYTMMFGDSFYYNTSNLRAQRHMKEVDISLSRVCFCMFCCMVLCLLLF